MAAREPGILVIRPIAISRGTALALYRDSVLLDAATQEDLAGRAGLGSLVWHVIYGAARRHRRQGGGRIEVVHV